MCLAVSLKMHTTHILSFHTDISDAHALAISGNEKKCLVIWQAKKTRSHLTKVNNDTSTSSAPIIRQKIFGKMSLRGIRLRESYSTS